MRLLLALLALVSALPVSAADVARFVSGEQGFAVNSWLVPTEHGIVVIDTQFTVTEADKLAKAVIKTGRPLRAIVITHPHPDHYNGTCQLLQLARVPVYATQSTIDGIRATAESKRTQWKPRYATDYPDTTCVPDHAVPIGASVQVDGVELQFHDYGPGEALGESMTLVPALHAVFVGDLIYNHVHPWLAEGRTAQWLAQLDRLTTEVPANWTVYPGHGPSGGVTVIDAQRKYIAGFRAATQARLGSRGLTPDSSREIVNGVRAHYPGWPLEMLIPINVEAVAKELSGPGATDGARDRQRGCHVRTAIRNIPYDYVASKTHNGKCKALVGFSWANRQSYVW
jgi:glyoxylase-like metal-dependent hydrolase (beta-lactamase superfamily II)